MDIKAVKVKKNSKTTKLRELVYTDSSKKRFYDNRDAPFYSWAYDIKSALVEE